jgi:2-methylcitrate dehydratase PrpD
VDAVGFARALRRADLPADVVRQAQRCLLDLVGVAAAASRTRAARLATAYAIDQLAGRSRSARILFDGRHAGLAGAAYAGASIIDAIDAHDGHPLTKGHAGVTVLPALLAFVDGMGIACDGGELLTCLVLGYEIGTRAGIALHSTVPDYHCSGAWNALAAAAIGARLLDLDEATTRHAFGIAEYFGPRGQILRVCHSPTMLKDGSGWGAHAGVSAVLLAQSGFTGAPAVTLDDAAPRPLWADLGSRWRIREQYFKPHPVCRWAQPAIEAALALRRAHAFDAADIARITVESFAEAVTLGAHCPRPATTDEAQYSITYPVATALVHGAMDAQALEPAALRDPRVARVIDVMELVEAPELSRRFPAERFARVRIELADGRVLASADTVARGSAENPLTDDEIAAKYRALAEPVLGESRAMRIADAIAALPARHAAQALLDDLLAAGRVEPVPAAPVLG